MKKKTKMLALLEIVIVLCSVLLVTLPAIAADQNHEMQKVSASTITTASKDDYVLGIYGNANEDDTIDMRDLTYVKLIFFGKKPETELADAKYDDKINPLDFIQVKLIIVGKEKELTVLNCRSGLGHVKKHRPPEVVTIHKPIERCVVLAHAGIAETFRALKSKDKIVGISKMIQDNKFFYPEISKLPCVGEAFSPDCEAILSLNPDLVLIEPWQDIIEKLPGVPVAYLGLRMMETCTDGVRKLGYILDSEKEAEEYANWFDGWTNKIKSRTEGLSDDEKPRVFITGPGMGAGPGQYTTVSNDNRFGKMCTLAGGKSIAADLTGWWITVDTEWVIVQNPDIIILWTGSYHGYGTDDPSELAAIREDIMNRPELANVNAVKTGRVYVSAFGKSHFTHGPSCLIGSTYMAKWFHPYLFEDLDPEAIHQEYLTRFQGLDYDLDKHGVFVYPPLEE